MIIIGVDFHPLHLVNRPFALRRPDEAANGGVFASIKQFPRVLSMILARITDLHE